MKITLPENIEKITLDFKNKKLFINDIPIDSKYDYLDICLDCDDWEISISNDCDESTYARCIQRRNGLHRVQEM